MPRVPQSCPCCGGASFWNVIHGWECMGCKSLLDEGFRVVRRGSYVADKKWVHQKKVTRITQDEEDILRKIVGVD